MRSMALESARSMGFEADYSDAVHPAKASGGKARSGFDQEAPTSRCELNKEPASFTPAATLATSEQPTAWWCDRIVH